jgi:ABC-2 type transport system ATP-binding protein
LVESFDLLRDIYRVPAADYRQTRGRLIEQLGVGEFLDQPVRQLSLGQRMRADLVASLLHQPEILFLDEPTIGLDAPGKLAIREFVRTINREDGVTVMLTSHDMDDIEALCSRLMVIGGGKIVADGSPDILHAEYDLPRRVVVDVEPFAELPPELVARMQAAGGTLEVAASRLTFEIYPARLRVPQLMELVSSTLTVRDLFVSAPPIEEIVSRIYESSDARS